MAALGEVLAAGALVQGERVLTGVALKGTVAQAAEKVVAKYGTVTTSAIKGAIDGAAGGMTSVFVLDITNAHLWDKGLYEGIARVVADTFTGALYGMGGGLLAGGGTAAAMKGGGKLVAGIVGAEEGEALVSKEAVRESRGAVGSEGAVTVASGRGGETLSMSVVRMVKKGEKIADIVNEGKALTFTTGNEHALVTLASGERAIVSGGPGGISFAEGQITRIFGHTHPTSAPPSAADFQALRDLGQTQQTVFHGGEVTKVRP